MNRLNRVRQLRLLVCLCKGVEIGRTADIVGCDPETVLRYLAVFGAACRTIQDELVVGLHSTCLEIDEMWSFVGGKSRNRKRFLPTTPKWFGDIWTWTALDPDSKLLVDWEVGRRGFRTGHAFLARIKTRLLKKVLITTDAYPVYRRVIKDLFTDEEAVHVWLKKEFKAFGDRDTGDYTVRLVGITKHHRRNIEVDTGLASTSLGERHHATMRSFIARLVRRTYSFSKKPDNHMHAHSIYAVFYNFCKKHRSLGHETAAMRAGIVERLWTPDDLLDKINETLAPKLDKTGLDDSSPQLVPLPRGEASAEAKFFVCNEVTRHTAKLHAGHCTSCLHGRGKKGGSVNNRWYAFADQAAAWLAAQILAPDHYSVCRICIGSYRTRTRSG